MFDSILARLRAAAASPTVRAWAALVAFLVLFGLAGASDRAHP